VASETSVRFVECPNVPRSIATVVRARLATLTELDTVYGLEDLWDLLEINAVDQQNQALANRVK
jgi:hypothetical protein